MTPNETPNEAKDRWKMKVKLPPHVTYDGSSFMVHYTEEELALKFKELQESFDMKTSDSKYREQAEKLSDFVPNDNERAALASRIESALKAAAEEAATLARREAIRQAAIVADYWSPDDTGGALGKAIRALAKGEK